MLFHKLPEGTHAVRAAVPVGIKHDETGSPESNAGHRRRKLPPELPDLSWVCRRPCLPAGHAGLLIEAPRCLIEADPHRKHRLYSPDWAGEERLYRMVCITEGAEKAEYFVVLEVGGVDFVIPDSVWEAIGRRREPPGPR